MLNLISDIRLFYYHCTFCVLYPISYVKHIFAPFFSFYKQSSLCTMFTSHIYFSFMMTLQKAHRTVTFCIFVMVERLVSFLFLHLNVQ